MRVEAGLVNVIGYVNKGCCQVSPGSTAIPTEEGVPAVEEVIVITYKEEQREEQSVNMLRSARGKEGGRQGGKRGGRQAATNARSDPLSEVRAVA